MLRAETAALRLRLWLWIPRSSCKDVSVLWAPRFPRGGGGCLRVGFHPGNPGSDLCLGVFLLLEQRSGRSRFVRGLCWGCLERLSFVVRGCCGGEEGVCGWCGTISGWRI